MKAYLGAKLDVCRYDGDFNDGDDTYEAYNA